LLQWYKIIAMSVIKVRKLLNLSWVEQINPS